MFCRLALTVNDLQSKNNTTSFPSVPVLSQQLFLVASDKYLVKFCSELFKTWGGRGGVENVKIFPTCVGCRGYYCAQHEINLQENPTKGFSVEVVTQKIFAQISENLYFFDQRLFVYSSYFRENKTKQLYKFKTMNIFVPTLILGSCYSHSFIHTTQAFLKNCNFI